MMTQHATEHDSAEERVPVKKQARRNFRQALGNDYLFGSLRPDLAEPVRKNQITQFFPAGAIVFGSGEIPKGIYLIREGKVNLPMLGRGAGGGASRVAGRGEVLGLTAMVSGKPCEVTSRTLTPAELTFVPRNAIIRLMDEDSDFAFRVLQYLCEDLGDAFESVRSQLRSHRRNHKNL